MEKKRNFFLKRGLRINSEAFFTQNYLSFAKKTDIICSVVKGDDLMQVSKEELLHIANLASLNLREEEVDNYLLNLQDILNFANIVSKAPVDGLTETIGVNDAYNVFRKDEIAVFGDNEALLSNAPEKERNMFKIPKVI